MEFTWSMALLVCPMAFLAGLMDAVAGGGGLISLPAYLAAGLPPHMAAATNKCSSVFGAAVSAARFFRRGRVHPAALLSAPLALAGSWLGALLNLRLPEQLLSWVMLGAVPVIGGVVLTRRDLGAESRVDRLSPRRLAALCALIGFALGLYDGFFGPGTGTFLILAFSGLAGFDLLTASGNAKLVNLCSNLAAFAAFAWSGEIVWRLGLPAAACSILGHFLGSGLALTRGAKVIRPAFLLVLALLLLKLVWALPG